MSRYLFIFFLCSYLFAQDRGRITPTVNLIRFPESLTISNLSSMGISFRANTHVVDIACGNPAALGQFKNLSAGVSWLFESDIEGSESIDLVLERNKSWLPQSAGLIYPYNDFFRLALGMNRRYSSYLEFEPIPIITPEMPMGTGEFFKPVAESSVITYSAIAGYTFNKLLSAQQMTFAFRYNLDYMSTQEEVLNIKAKTSDYDHSWAFGIIAVFELPALSISFGASYEKDIHIEEDMNSDSNLLIVDSDTTMNSNIISQLDPTTVIAQIPARVNFGTSLTFSSDFVVEVSVSQVLWSEISAGLDDVIEFAASLSRPLMQGLTTSVGLYNTGLNYEGVSAIDEPDALYLTAGARLSLGKFVVDLALADNHISSLDRRKQTIVKIAGSFIF